MLRAAISSDIDTLQSIYGGRGCRRVGGYTFAEFQIGLDNSCRFLERYGAQATFFMVGEDFRRPPITTSSVPWPRGARDRQPHLTHAQDFGC